MSVLDSILVAVFCLSLVFVVLIGLYGFIVLFSLGLNKFVKKEEQKPADLPTTVMPVVKTEMQADLSTGELKLKDVDERTAAMIMAIVSDESGIPLSELCFKSIKAL